MSRRRKRPAYLLHKATGQARVRISGRDLYLGAYDSAESRARYGELIDKWRNRNGDASAITLAVDDLVLSCMERARYRKDGQPTSEVNCIKQAVRPLLAACGPTLSRDFGPRALKDVRKKLIEAGIVRRQINIHVGRIRRCSNGLWGNGKAIRTLLYRSRGMPGFIPGPSDTR